ncbi:MAG: 50S ribosomal protein L25 [Chloroflexi bacterium]|nr:50S ribosomal protein L25 [Chloroflexota bacterium]
MVQTLAKAELEVTRREVLGKKVKTLRRQGITPANIFGRNVDSLAVQLPTDRLVYVLRHFGRNEIVHIRLDGDEPRPTFIRHIQRNPITDEILHVDFHQISLTEKVRMEVALHLVGTAPAVSMYNGTLLHSLDYLTVEGMPGEIPSHLEVDVSGLEEIDSAVHVRDIAVPSNLTVLTDLDLVVAKVAPPAKERVEEVEEEVPEEEAAAEEEGAAPEAEAGGEEQE